MQERDTVSEPKWRKRGRLWKILRGDPRFLVAGGILCIMVFVAIFAPFLTHYSPTDTRLRDRLLKPGAKHLLGTDQYGRDVASRIIWGTRISLAVGVLVVIISMLLGCAFGTVAGFFGGIIDISVMRLVDILLAFPGFLLALVLVATFGSKLSTVIIAISIAYFPRIAMVMRSVILTVRENAYIEAAQAAGAGSWWIVFKHVLPNAFPPIIVVGTISAATAITAEAGLSFLGLGVQPPVPTWGNIISDGREFIRNAPWISIFAGLAIMLSVISLNLFGDALRDMLDPKMKGSMKNV